MASVPDAATVLKKWKARTGAAQQDYADGVANTDKDPTALAIAAIPRMRSRILEAIDSGKVANGLRASGKSGWQHGVATKGVQNFSQGVNNADDAFTKAFTPLLSYIGQVKTTIAGMADVTDADRDQRMLKNAQLMRQYKKPA